MTHKASSEEQQKELSWEDAVARYLDDHPDFFDRHPDVLVKLNLSHAIGGRAISLIERQVGALRETNTALERQLRELVVIARENDVLAARLHRFALAMSDSASLDDVFDTAYEMLRREFKLDAAAILCCRESGPGFARAELAGADARLQDVLKQLNGGRPLCGGKFDESLSRYLFGARAAEIKSSALIALGNKDPLGVLCLGSHDPHRFHPGMGTVYLVKLGDILMHSIARFT